MLGKIYILLTYLVFNVQFLFSQALAYCFVFKKIKCSFTKVNSALIFLNACLTTAFFKKNRLSSARISNIALTKKYLNVK
ncbi:hypothetical protein CAC37_02225 [Staphylococcus aureus subsp. aureus ST398]|nr:hypothetical protein CAC37_02225 [Staphylococcus aureus subsp. aureus ST398]